MNLFNRIKGQDRAVDILKRALQQDKIAQSYLFHGPEGTGKFTTAFYFAMAINCTESLENRPCGVCNSCRKYLAFSHPDFIYTFPFPNPKNDISEDGEIKSEQILTEYQDYIKNKQETPWKEFFFSKNTGIRIGSIRLLEHRMNLSPNEGTRKVFLLEDADTMNTQAANAFLKTLEEPPGDAVIILTSSKLNSLLPTIISRCQQIAFQPVKRRLIEQALLARGSEPLPARMFSRIANGNMEKALRLAEQGEFEAREKALEFIRLIVEGDDLKFLDFLQEFRGTKNLNRLQELISHLIIWVSDVSCLQHDPDEIVNLDQPELLKKLYNLNPQIGQVSYELVEFLEKMNARLEGFVNQQLIMLGIFHKFREEFSR